MTTLLLSCAKDGLSVGLGGIVADVGESGRHCEWRCADGKGLVWYVGVVGRDE